MGWEAPAPSDNPLTETATEAAVDSLGGLGDHVGRRLNCHLTNGRHKTHPRSGSSTKGAASIAAAPRYDRATCLALPSPPATIE